MCKKIAKKIKVCLRFLLLFAGPDCCLTDGERPGCLLSNMNPQPLFTPYCRLTNHKYNFFETFEKKKLFFFCPSDSVP